MQPHLTKQTVQNLCRNSLTTQYTANIITLNACSWSEDGGAEKSYPPVTNKCLVFLNFYFGCMRERTDRALALGRIEIVYKLLVVAALSEDTKRDEYVAATLLYRYICIICNKLVFMRYFNIRRRR